MNDNNELKATIKTALMEVLGEMGGTLVTVTRNSEPEDDDPLMRFSDTLNAKVDDEAIWDAFSGNNAKQLAEQFGISQALVYRAIKRGKEREIRFNNEASRVVSFNENELSSIVDMLVSKYPCCVGSFVTDCRFDVSTIAALPAHEQLSQLSHLVMRLDQLKRTEPFGRTSMNTLRRSM